VFGNLDERLALVFEILLTAAIEPCAFKNKS